jgi:beta-lactamase superfamily II metal-dependent hydrolase
MYEVDFLPVESDAGPGSKSGDAITIHFKRASNGEDMVVVIDGGFTDVGDDIAHHITKYYNTNYIDLVISTHPDADHINGIARLLEQSQVGELLVHQPRLHNSDVRDFSNIEAVDNLLRVAQDRGVRVSEPFTGLTRYEGQLLILGPARDYYETLVKQHLAEMSSGTAAAATVSKGRVVALAQRLLERVLSYFPIETLTDEGETGPRNNSSVITLLQLDGDRLLFTGDAGVPALESAADFYESSVGRFNSYPLAFVQIPHHGSRRNVGPGILDRVLGSASRPFGSTVAFASSAKADEKHPSPKVLNAFGRRGCRVAASEGRAICHSNDASPRLGWSTITPLPPLREDDDD